MNIETLLAPPLTETSPASRGFVLIVDDEEPNRALLRDSLEARGYEIAEASSGEQALQSIAERQPDVLLLDVMMPQMDGFELCRRLKSDPQTSGIPILMVTALSERKERMLGIAAGANDFLTKPVDLHDLTLRVRNAVQLRHLAAQLKAERDESERLLRNILPPAIAWRMKAGEVNIADHHPDVSVLMADLVGFTLLSAHISPDQVVSLLNEIFSAFDELVLKHGLEKIKTIGDAYMVAGGLTAPRTDHAEAMARLALDLRAEIERLNQDYHTSIRIRIGMSSGPVVAGVIGRKRIGYDLWGATVNLACRLEAAGEAGSIMTSEPMFTRLKDKFRFQRKDGILLKGQDAATVFQLIGPL